MNKTCFPLLKGVMRKKCIYSFFHIYQKIVFNSIGKIKIKMKEKLNILLITLSVFLHNVFNSSSQYKTRLMVYHSFTRTDLRGNIIVTKYNQNKMGQKKLNQFLVRTRLDL